MSTRNQHFTIHPATGGLDTTSNPTTLGPEMLTRADNLEYLESGQRKKRAGFVLYSNLPTPVAGNVRALSDFWRYGTSLTPTQNFVAVVGASIIRSTGNATFNTITTTSSFGSNTNTTTNLTLAGDYIVISDGVSSPVTYDQTTLTSTTLSGAPIFTQSAYHLRRLFYSGLSTAPSQISFTAAGLNGVNFDSTGTDSGGLFIDEGDGDRVIGFSRPFHKRLYIFKGPQFGSVHELSGATPSGFNLDKISVGAPAMNANGIVTTANDIFWISRYGIHSLITTMKYGDTEQAFLSLPIQSLFRDSLDFSTIDGSFGFWHPLRNLVGWFVPPAGGGQQFSWALVYNIALSDPNPRGKKFWSLWTFLGLVPVSAQVMITPAAASPNPLRPRLYLGGTGGNIYAGDSNVLWDAGNAYTATVQTPVLSRLGDIATETSEKQFYGVTTYFVPKGNYSANLLVTVDTRQQSQTVSLLGGGAVFNSTSTGTSWDNATFGGLSFQYAENVIEDRGRAIMLQWNQSGLQQDLELLGYSIRYAVSETEPKEQV